MAKLKGLNAAMTKTQIMADIAGSTGLAKKEVASVFAALETIIARHIKKGSVGHCTVPGLLKIKTVKKPAQKAKKNVPNPFSPGEFMDVKAKPASTRVKILALKKLKDMA